MDRQCTGGRIESKEKLESSLAVWSKERNKNKQTIEWKFTKQDAVENYSNIMLHN
jgi:hypothetical protein